MIELWKEEVEELKKKRSELKSQEGKMALSQAIRKLNKKISDEENRINSKLNKVTIDGKEYIIPSSFNWGGFDKYTLKLDGDVLYVIDKTGVLDKDGSYHWYHYAWIPQTKNKFARLTLRTLGKDIYGDRCFAEVSYFKHPADRYSYLNKNISPRGNTYKQYIEFILQELNLIK